MNSLAFPWLMLLLAIPAVVGLIGLFPVEAERFRRLALGAASLLFVVGIGAIWAASPFSEGGASDPWDPAHLILGKPILRIDELSSILVPFAALLWVLAVGVTPRMALARDGIRRTALATLATLATFLTEAPLLILALWIASTLILLRGLRSGGFRRAYRIAAIYHTASTLLLTAGFLAASRPEGDLPSSLSSMCILLAVMIRMGVFPLHGWLPECFEHGRIGPAVLFTAPQVGAYVAITALIPRAPAGLLTVAGLLAMGTALYGAVATMTQRDARRAFGYLYVSQSALVLAGLECVSVEGLTGGLCLWLSSGIAFAALARCLAVLEARRGRLMLDRFNGGYDRMPLLASSFLLTALATVGFPGTLGFIGHELLVDGTITQHPRTGFLLIVATAFGAIALMRIYFALFCGRIDTAAPLRLRAREIAIFGGFSGLLLATGLSPRPILSSREAAAMAILGRRVTISSTAIRDVTDSGRAPEPVPPEARLLRPTAAPPQGEEDRRGPLRSARSEDVEGAGLCHEKDLPAFPEVERLAGRVGDHDGHLDLHGRPSEGHAHEIPAFNRRDGNHPSREHVARRQAMRGVEGDHDLRRPDAERHPCPPCQPRRHRDGQERAAPESDRGHLPVRVLDDSLQEILVEVAG